MDNASPFRFTAWTRRRFIGSVAATTLSIPFLTRDLLAAELARTPRDAEGPFYPDKFPLDTDNDLVLINDNKEHSIGTLNYLSGKVLNTEGNPINNATVEIWQCDENGVYIHSADAKRKTAKQDKNFQGFGRFLTGPDGRYNFRTIRPAKYAGRTPHIHVKVWRLGKELLTTQCYDRQAEAQNKKDGLFNRIAEDQRKNVLVDYKKVKDSKVGAVMGTFDIVLGLTPKD